MNCRKQQAIVVHDNDGVDDATILACTDCKLQVLNDVTILVYTDSKLQCFNDVAIFVYTDCKLQVLNEHYKVLI